MILLSIVYSFVSVVISGLVLSLICFLEKLSTHVILLLGYLAILPCVSAIPTQDFPHIPFKLFNEFIQETSAPRSLLSLFSLFCFLWLKILIFSTFTFDKSIQFMVNIRGI